MYPILNSPLFLAWAVTIHKCQGLTLPEIVVDMSWEKGSYHNGQAYVTFRLTSLDKLHIVNYTWEQIKILSSVKDEMDRLCSRSIPSEKTPLIKSYTGSLLCILHLNIGSLPNKHLDVHTDENYKYADIISFNEKHLTDHISLSHSMLGIEDKYDIFQHNHGQNGGGVMLLVARNYKPACVSLNTDIDIIGVKFNERYDMYIVSV